MRPSVWMRTTLPRWLSSDCAPLAWLKRSPRVRNSVSLSCTMRQPKCRRLATLGCWRKITRTLSRRARSADSSARASAVPLRCGPRSEGRAKVVPVGSASLKQKYSTRLRAKSVSVTTSSSPPCPPAATAGTPASAGPMRPSGCTTRMRPGRSVTKNRPCGRKATAHGCTSPWATTSVVTSVSATGRLAADGSGCMPCACAQDNGAWASAQHSSNQDERLATRGEDGRGMVAPERQKRALAK